MSRRHAKNREEDRGTDVEISGNDLENETDPFAALGEKEDDEILQVERKSPLDAVGFMGEMTRPDNVYDIKPEIARQWGGGTYLVRRKGRVHNGKMVYRNGSIRLQIAGPSKDPEGRPLKNPGSASSNAPIVFSPPPQNGGDINASVFKLLSDLLSKTVSKDAAGNPSVDFVGLVTALQGALQARPAADDPLGQFERSIALMGRMRKLWAPQADDDDDEGGGLLGGLLGGGKRSSMLEMLLMQKLMGADGLNGLIGTPKRQPNPGSAMPASGMPGVHSPMPPIPPGYVWHPQHGLIPFPETPKVQNRPEQGGNVVSHPENGFSEPATNEPEIDDPPTADDLIADLEDMDENEQGRFLAALAKKMGASDDDLSAISSTLNSRWQDSNREPTP